MGRRILFASRPACHSPKNKFFIFIYASNIFFDNSNMLRNKVTRLLILLESKVMSCGLSDIKLSSKRSKCSAAKPIFHSLNKV